MTLKLSLGNGHDQHLTQTGHGIIRSKVKVTLTFNEKNTNFCNNFELVVPKFIKLDMDISHDH